MPLNRLVWILVIVIAGAALTVWLGTMVVTAVKMPTSGWLTVIPVALVGYVIWRVISARLSNGEDDQNDRIEK